MSVSIFMLILWLFACWGNIAGAKMIIRPLVVPKKEFGDDNIKDTVLVVLGAALVFIMTTMAIAYYYLSAGIVDNIWFGMLSTIIIIRTFFNFFVSICNIDKLLNNTLEPGNIVVKVIFTILQFCHVVYFGYYIFTGNTML